MEKFELALPRFFISLFICCITLLAGCDNRNSHNSADPDSQKPDASAGITQEESEANFSVGAQQASSTQYKSSSIIGEMAGSKMRSQKYQLSATFVVPNQIPNKQEQ